MRNTIRSQRTVTDEELDNIKKMDWETYYQESSPADQQGLANCPDCGAIIIARESSEPVICYQCGRKI